MLSLQAESGVLFGRSVMRFGYVLSRAAIAAAVLVISVSACHADQGSSPAFSVGTPSAIILYPYQPANYAGPIEQAIKISAARREIEPFMLYIIAGAEPLKDVTVTVTDIVSSGGDFTIGQDKIEVAPMAYVKTPKPRSTDKSVAGETAAIRRLKEGHVARILRRDIKSFDVAANSQQAVWVNVEVPPNAGGVEFAYAMTTQFIKYFV